MTTFNQIADQLDADGHHELASELRGCKDVRDSSSQLENDLLISASIYTGPEEGLQAAVSEMIARLGECDSSSDLVNLALTAIVERDAKNGIFAYQFLTTPGINSELPAYMNIATWIPGHDGLNKNLLQIQQPGGRPYGIAIKERRIIANEVVNHFFSNYSHFPDFKETLGTGDLGDLTRNLYELVQQYGVRTSVAMLESAERQFQSDRDYVKAGSDNYGA